MFQNQHSQQRLEVAKTTRRRRTHHWSVSQIRWGAILRYQHYGGLLLFIPAVVITGM